MDIEVLLQVALRVLPAVLVLVLGLAAAADQKSRERWADLLYQAGSLRPEQRTDPKVQRGVRLPFFLVALALLWWPVRYYRYATTIVEIKSDLYSRPRVSAPPASNSVPGADATTNAASPANPSSPAAPVTGGVNSPPAAGTAAGAAPVAGVPDSGAPSPDAPPDAP